MEEEPYYALFNYLLSGKHKNGVAYTLSTGNLVVKNPEDPFVVMRLYHDGFYIPYEGDDESDDV